MPSPAAAPNQAPTPDQLWSEFETGADAPEDYYTNEYTPGCAVCASQAHASMACVLAELREQTERVERLHDRLLLTAVSVADLLADVDPVLGAHATSLLREHVTRRLEVSDATH